MRKRQIFGLALLLVLLLLGPFGTGTVHADFIYSVSVDTSSINTTSGYLDLVFNAAGANSQLAYASVTNFQTNGTLASTSSTDGDASGVLPGTLSLDNGVNASPPSGFNDVFQGITFGNSLSFDVTLSGPAVDTPNSNGYGSSFFLYLYDSSGNTLLTTDTNYGGAAAVITLNSNGTASVSYVSPEGSATPETSAVPEPSSMLLLLTGLPAFFLGLFWRRRMVVAT